MISKSHFILIGNNTPANQRVAKIYCSGNRYSHVIKDNDKLLSQKKIYVEFHIGGSFHNKTIINDKEATKFLEKNKDTKIIDFSNNDVKFRRLIIEKSRKFDNLVTKFEKKFNSLLVELKFIDEIEYVISEIISEEKYRLIGYDAAGEDMSFTKEGSQISTCRSKDKKTILWKDIWQKNQDNSFHVYVCTYFDDEMEILDSQDIVRTVDNGIATKIKVGMRIREALTRLIILFI